MLKFDFRQMITRPITEVFDYASDPRNILSSDPSVVVTMDEDDRKGSNFQMSFDSGRKKATVIVLEYNPPTLYEFEAHINIPTMYVIRGSYMFSESGMGSEMYAD